MNAIDQDQLLQELDLRERESWARYSESLRDLSGRAYEQAEGDSWELLQAELRDIADEREELLAPV